MVVFQVLFSLLAHLKKMSSGGTPHQRLGKSYHVFRIFPFGSIRKCRYFANRKEKRLIIEN